MERLLVWLGGGRPVAATEVAAVIAQADASGEGGLAPAEVEAAVAVWYVRQLQQGSLSPAAAAAAAAAALPSQLAGEQQQPADAAAAERQRQRQQAVGPGPTFLSVQHILAHRKGRCFATVDLDAAGHEAFEASLVVGGRPLPHLLQVPLSHQLPALASPRTGRVMCALVC